MTRSEEFFQQAKKFIPGGVNSPVRAFLAVGGGPRFIDSAAGSHISDVDGRDYIDYVGSWGPLILGHAPHDVVAALQKVCERGTSFGAPTAVEVDLARMITQCVPSIEKVRMVNSGTEATLSAIRLARAFTGRDKIIKFAGCYHGHADSFLIAAGSGVATLGIPDSPGVPKAVAAETLVAEYNHLESVHEITTKFSGEIAAIIVEPVAGNMGVVPPVPGFLEELREICTSDGIVLIFDEVMTGFRVALGGAQALYGVIPDLTTLGKIIGGGMPVGAYGGRAEIMDLIAPEGPVYQAGTLSGNPLAMTAGIETLKAIQKPGFYADLEKKANQMVEAMRENLRALNLKCKINQVGSMFTLFFTEGPVTNWGEVEQCNRAQYAAYFHAMLERGIYLPPSQFETAFLSSAHTDADIQRTIRAQREALTLVRV
jgi:glutamate-1-semialdehyde 2,1-aminomutase